MKEPKEMTTYELITTLTKMEQEINMLSLQYEEIRLEIINRFPQLEGQEEFENNITRKVR